MKKKDLKELHQNDINGLKVLLKKTQQEFIKAKLELHLGKNKNWRLPTLKRREIAQIKSIMNTKTNAIESLKKEKEVK